MDVDNRRSLPDRSLPDVYYVDLHHRAAEWTNGTLPQVYRFRVTGKSRGTRWIVHSIYANRPAPPEWKLRTMRVLKQTINHALSELLKKEIPHWESSLLSWEDH
jgi:hypothetical protein